MRTTVTIKYSRIQGPILKFAIISLKEG